MSTTISDPEELFRILKLPPEPFEYLGGDFPLKVPVSFVSRMKRGNRNDPLLLQVLPSKKELLSTEGFSTDPLGEQLFDSCILSKYNGRVLVLATDSCPVNCRFCFRRHLPKGRSLIASEQADCLKIDVEKRLEAIRNDKSIREVILSGGEPLMLPVPLLQDILRVIGNIPHIDRIRVHTRLPIMIPEAITGELADLFFPITRSDGSRCLFYAMIHVNHPNEIDEKVAAAIDQFARRGVPIFAQTVLLQGINDDFDTLAELFEKCANNRIAPYYLHQLDKVAGTAHFEVAEENGRNILKRLRTVLPGYAVPRYVREIPGDSCKTPLEFE